MSNKIFVDINVVYQITFKQSIGFFLREMKIWLNLVGKCIIGRQYPWAESNIEVVDWLWVVDENEGNVLRDRTLGLAGDDDRPRGQDEAADGHRGHHDPLAGHFAGAKRVPPVARSVTHFEICINLKSSKITKA